jgi:hypothetical protein
MYYIEAFLIANQVASNDIVRMWRKIPVLTITGFDFGFSHGPINGHPNSLKSRIGQPAFFRALLTRCGVMGS